ncbi:MAG: hypothetical protein KAY32_06125 [Candidatus Eisenbacteria sp.]|nr:hypothetical protein [Candidatus Eisenbacteria bacterium]
MWSIALVINGIFNVIFAPFKAMHPAIGLLVISVITGIVMLLIFGKTSNQRAIRYAKGKLKAHISEIWLFRDDLPQMLIAFFRVLANTGRYFVHSLRPLIFLMIPVIIIMVMLGVRYQHRPFHPGESALVSVKVDDPSWTHGDAVQLLASPGLKVASAPLRIPDLREIDWRVEALAPGEHELTLQTPAGEITKTILVSEGKMPLVPIAPGRGQTFSAEFLTFPVEPPLPKNTGIVSLKITGWPTRDLRILGLKVNWLIAFFVISMVAGFSVKGLFGVEV